MEQPPPTHIQIIFGLSDFYIYKTRKFECFVICRSCAANSGDHREWRVTVFWVTASGFSSQTSAAASSRTSNLVRCYQTEAVQ